MLSLPAKAQSSAGIKADANRSTFWASQSANLNSKHGTGGAAGFFYNYTYRENAAIQADVMFRYRSSKMEYQTTGETTDFSYFGIDLPVYLLRQAVIDDQKLYFGVGPFASYGFRSRFKSDAHEIDPYKTDPAAGDAMLRRLDLGFALIIGYETRYRLQFNFNYQLGLRNILQDGFENASMISQLISLGAGYRF